MNKIFLSGNLTRDPKVRYTPSGKYLAKGSRVLVEGRLQNNIYEKDGVKHYAEKIVVENIEFAGGKSEKKIDEPKDDFDGSPVDDDDMPF